MEKELKQESLLDKWKNREQKTSNIKPIEKAPLGVKTPLSYGQKRLFFLQQLYPDNPFYNYSETYTFTGKLVKEHLIESLNRVYNDHDILRTTYHADGDTVFQEVDASAEMDISIHDLSKLNELDAEVECHKLMLADATKYFKLDKGPLVCASLIKINNEKHILQITLHHIVTDKWSMQIFRAHLAHYYRQFNNIQLSELKNHLQYTDYAYWLENQEINNDHLNYWKNKLSGEIPSLNLPTDYSRPKHPSFKGAASYTQVFNKDLSEKILKLSKKSETTPFNLMLSVYYILLYKYSGQTDILIGTPVTNRNQKVLEDLIGFFNDTIVLRTNLSPSMTFMDFVETVRKNTLEAFSNKDVPFDALVRELKTNRTLSLNPFFQVMFLYHSVPENPFFDDNLSLTHTWFDSKVAKFDLTIYISEEHGLFSSTFEYASDLFEEETINRFQDYFKLLLEGIVSNPNIVIADIPIINEKEKTFLCNQKNEFSNHFLEEQAIHKIIEQIAYKYPENKAVTFGNVSMTYKELDHKASLVAQSLLKNITTINEVIGLCLDRSINMIVGMLGILKAGCAYLPIDTDYPKERVNFMLKDSNVKILLTQKNITIHDTGLDISTLFIENLTDTINELNTLDYPQTSEDDLAYIIYTSGSTGQPKGVPITNKNIINSTAGRIDFYNHNPSAFLLLSSISFDSSKAGIFWTLCTGGNLVVGEKRLEQDIDKIGDILKDHSISHTLMLPSLYQTILEFISQDKFKTLKTVIVAGEACTESLCDSHFDKLPKVKLYNEYGPTEATVWCIAHEITKETTINYSIPIGKPVAGANIYLLDEKLNLVPKGAVGEIYIGGAGISKGYLNRPELTQQVFVTNPFNTEEKLYKTGDLGKFRNDGNIVFLGRKDQQVKIRGFRVELEEIEQILMDSTMFHGVVLNLENNHPDNESESSSDKPKQLVAYVIAKTHYNKAALKSYLKKRIPDYMIPAKIIELEAFPKLPNGKIDKKALSILKYTHSSANQKESNVELPKNETEQSMLQIWQDVLKIDAISTNDNFFEIGGDSILSIQIIARARKMGMMISPNQLFEFQNIKDISEYIDANKNNNEAWDYIAPLRKGGYKKPLFCIHAGGGHVFFYNLLTEYINPERPIYAIQPSGLYGSEAMHKNVQEMTEDYIKSITKIQPDGPYNVVVYCLSVAVGHEMAIQMKKRGMDLNLIVMDTMANPWKLNTTERKLIRAKNFYKRFKKNPYLTIKLVIVDRIPSLKLKIRKLLSINKNDHFQKVKDNLVNICVDYIWKPYPVKISLILTEKHEESLNEETIKSWKNLALDEVEIIFTKGNHRTLFEKPDVEFVAKTIEKCLK